MATQHLDLEEQEQIDQIKAFWRQWGNIITWLLIAVLGSYAAYNGWQYWQNRQGHAAAQLFDEVNKAAQANDLDKLKRVVSDLSAQTPSSVLAQHAQLLLAKAAVDKGETDVARAALASVGEQSPDAGLKAVAALRLVALDMDAQQWDSAMSALAALEQAGTPGFKGLIADRRGDILQAKGDKAGAGEQYLAAWAALADDGQYRQLVEVKLNALGLSAGAAAN
ncbi:MAG: tetratricopeptide repeat protein [Burkholderiaceae bacterium]|jgi:predicted negative regulator of RcsB-dependent stress response|nr:tetratricopeptide repeat protein [Burkholderiaceae bacterium]